jgi:hypothetical protein
MPLHPWAERERQTSCSNRRSRFCTVARSSADSRNPRPSRQDGRLHRSGRRRRLLECVPHCPPGPPRRPNGSRPPVRWMDARIFSTTRGSDSLLCEHPRVTPGERLKPPLERGTSPRPRHAAHCCGRPRDHEPLVSRKPGPVHLDRSSRPSLQLLSAPPAQVS